MFCSIGRTFIQEWLVEVKRFSAAKDRAAKDMRKSLPCAACSECLTKPWPSHLSWAAQPLPRCFLGSENPAHGRSSWIARFNHPPSMSSLKNIHIIIYVYIYIHTYIYIYVIIINTHVLNMEYFHHIPIIDWISIFVGWFGCPNALKSRHYPLCRHGQWEVAGTTPGG